MWKILFDLVAKLPSDISTTTSNKRPLENDDDEQEEEEEEEKLSKSTTKKRAVSKSSGPEKSSSKRNEINFLNIHCIFFCMHSTYYNNSSRSSSCWYWMYPYVRKSSCL